MSKTYSLRKFINDIHLWLGLASGLVLFVVCLSGTIYTFRAEVEEWLDKDKYFVALPQPAVAVPVDILLPQLEQSLNGKVTSLELPQATDRALKVGVQPGKKEEPRAAQAGSISGAKAKEGQAAKNGKKGKGDRGKTYFVNPYTGAVTGEEGGPTSEFFTTMMKLHRWLLIEGDWGRIIVGSATIIFVILCISGLVLWFPKRLKNWKQGLKIKATGNWKRTNHDLHNTLGFYSLIFLVIMGLTGLCWSFDWYRDGVSDVMGHQVFKGRGEKPLPSALTADLQQIPASQALSAANEAFPYEGNTRLTLPKGDTGSFVIYKYTTGFFALSAPDKMQIDQYTGKTLKLERFADKPLNVQIVDSIRPLHLGEFTGTSSKILWFICCLIATSLPVTGTFIWLNKLKKKRGKKKINTVVPKQAAIPEAAEV